ncbi:MAG: SEC-C domain-containing protein, partial [Clostridia bacterium]|nr:SEC-C domain-containing protein [Clostridia bacterium]
RIMNFLDNQIVSVLQFINDKRMDNIKNIAYSQEIFMFSKNKNNHFSFDTIKILKQLGFIYCKKEPDGIIIHMPKYIRDKVNNIVGNIHLDYYNAIISYSKGIADTYGAIHIQDAFEIIKNDILISFERYDNIIKFISILELEPIYYSFQYQCLCSFNLRDEEVADILTSKKDIIIYNKKMYEDMGNDNYLFNLKEYKEFRNFLREYYHFDINEEEMLRGEIICDYIDNAQIDEKEAKEVIKESLNRYFEIDDIVKQIIIGYVDKIKKKMPIWKQGGKIDNIVQFTKVGRNEPCPCGSGKKYKNCCGKNS